MAKSKILTGIGLLIAVAGLGVGIGLLASRRNTPYVPPVDTTVNSTGVQSSNPAPVSNPRPTAHHNPIAANTQVPPVMPVEPAVVANTQTTALITNWEERLENILGSDDEDTNKVKQLISMFPQLPAEGQEEVAQHLSNLVDDEDYAQLGNLTTNATLPESVLDTLLADLLNRPNGTKLPMFLDIAQNPNHPKAGEAKDYLELYLDEDYGTDWTTWKKKMQDWLKENPD